MSFSDVFKKSFVSSFSMADMSLKHVVLSLAIVCMFAVYIFFVYRIVTRKTFYRQSFNITLSLVSIIIASIVLAIQSNIVVSLGMVGALSIVRFRTAIKDPVDLMFLFWSIAVGIIVGAGLSGIAMLASALITGGIVFFEMIPIAKAPVLLIVSADKGVNREEIISCVKENTSAYAIKSQTYGSDRLELIIEVRIKQDSKLLDLISSMDGIRRCSLINHDGEVTF